jgi:hypothetical protein
MLLLCGTGLLVGSAALVTGCGGPPPASVKKAASTEGSDEPLENAKDALLKATDQTSCRSALQQVQAYINQSPAHRPPALSDSERATLKQAGLDDKEMDEVAGSAFTLLDGHHLDQCFLFRDAAHSLDVESLPKVDQAAAAFAWVIRQVRLRAPEPEAEPLPPHFIVRRGWGTPLERSLVFLAILRQLDIPACLLSSPDNGKPFYWACGAVASDDKGVPALYLFDARMGLPLPGPQGRGIATFAELRADPGLLQQLTTKDAHYDISPEQVKQAEQVMEVPLSTYSPRMRYLQDTLLAPTVAVRLGLDPLDTLNRLTAAAKGADGATPSVRIDHALTGTLRNFLPLDEGGSDASKNRVRLAQWSMIPTRSLEFAFFRNFLGDLPDDLSNETQSRFASPFVYFSQAPQSPRDDILRGHLSRAPELLTLQRDEWRRLQDRQGDIAELIGKMRGWKQQVIGPRAELIRFQQAGDLEGAEQAKARVEAVNKQFKETLQELPLILAAPALHAECTYLLALCKHEQAERLQAQLDRSRKTGEAAVGKADPAAVREAWKETRAWWETFARDNAATPLVAPAVNAARLLQARCYAALGDTDHAVATLEDLPNDLTDLERTARLYSARQLKAAAKP